MRRFMDKWVLIIEDDPDIADLLLINLKDMGFQTHHAADGQDGLNEALSGKYEMVILDVMLPRMDGLDVCKNIRKKDQTLPILMLTSRSEEFDKVLGLELGADDYLTKPFSLRELMARVKALLRRVDLSQQVDGQEPKELDFGKLCINLEKRKVMLEDSIIDLTAKEFDLLALFAVNPGRAYSRQELLDIVWGYQFDGYDHTVNSHINRLRGKIEQNPSEPVFIKTVWGVGYRFTEPEELD